MAEELPDAPWASASLTPPPVDLPDAPWTPAARPAAPSPSEHPDAPWVKPQGDMPGPLDAIGQGLQAAYKESKQSGTAITGGTPTNEAETPSPAAAHFEWSDLSSPVAQGLPKVSYRLAKSAPTLAAGIAGGVVGSPAGPVGTIAGGALGSAAGAAFQTLGPSFANELKKSPNDPDGAWNRALEQASISGAFSGAAWALFPVRFFQGPVKQLAFQAFGVQPAVSVAGQATQNVVAGKPVTEGLGEAYTEGAVGTAVPAAGHAALSALTGGARGAVIKPDMVEAHHAIDAAAPPPADPEPSRWDSVPFANQFKAMTSGWKNTFQPELVSDLSLQSQGVFREFNASKAQGKDSVIHSMDEMHNFFERLPEETQMAFMKGYAKEEGVDVPPELQKHADLFHSLLDTTWRMDKSVGSKLGYVEDYFPRQFENPDQAKAFINNRIQSLGPKWFLKARTNDLLQEGLDAGLKLVTTNPADLVTNRLLSGVNMREKTKLMQKLGDLGAAAKITDPGMASDYSKAGWQLVKDPVGNDWAIHPDIQPMWKNVVDSQGLWGAKGPVGNVFRGWMALKNAWVPLKLSLSAFHPLHVAHINVVDGFTRGWTQLTKGGDVTGALNSAAKGVYGQFYHPEALAARRAWLTPEWNQTPEQRGVVKMMTEGGFSPQLSEQLRMQGSRNFQDALAHSQWAKAVPLGAYNGFKKMQAAIFEKWIPSLKTAAYLDEAKALFERRPDLLDNDNLRKAALGTIAKSVDNRFGEMFYSNLFWNRTLKDAGIGSFLSLGWNLGFAREFGGGLLEPFVRPLMEKTPTREAMNAAKSKTAFMLFYMANAMALNALMTKGMTGENPDGMDYFLPRMGGNNPDGSPRRLSNMFYTREVPMAMKHIQERGGAPIAGLREMIWNKMMFEPIHELMNNRDYYGFNIMDEGSPWYQQYYQLGKFILSDQFNPITIMGAKRGLQASGKWNDNDSLAQKTWKIMSEPEGQLALAGFGPAPAYASKSAAQNRLGYLFGQYVSPAERPQSDRDVMDQRRDARAQLMLAQTKKDPEAITAAAKRLNELGVKTQSIQKIKPGTSDLYLYQRLPQAVQASFLKDLSKEDFQRYYPKSNKKTKADPEVMKRFKQYYGIQ